MTQPTTQAIEKAREIAEEVFCARHGEWPSRAERIRAGKRDSEPEVQIALRALSAAASEREQLEARQWRTMESAPLDGTHCILAVPEPSGFIYNAQGAYQNGQWNAVHRDNISPIYWMPNPRLPDGWIEAEPYVQWKAARAALEIKP